MSKLFITFFVFLFSAQAVAEDQAIATLFAQRGIEVTIVISALHSGQTFIHNDTRANQRFTTASTFKILNTLIVLEEKAISGKDDEKSCGSLLRIWKSVAKKTCPCA